MDQTPSQYQTNSVGVDAISASLSIYGRNVDSPYSDEIRIQEPKISKGRSSEIGRSLDCYLIAPTSAVLGVTIVTFINFLLVFWVAHFIGEKSRWRGLSWALMVAYGIGFMGLVDVSLYGRGAVLQYAVLSSALYAIFAGSIPLVVPQAGFVTNALGGCVLQQAVLLGWVCLVRCKRGWSVRQSLLRVAVFQLQVLVAWLTACNGLASLIWWIPVTKVLGWFAGPLLSFNFWFSEYVARVGITRILKYSLEHCVPYCRMHASFCIMVVHTLAEAFRVSAMMTGAVKNPRNYVWLGSVVYSLVLRILTRTGWVRYGVWVCTTSTFFLPAELTKLHHMSKFAWGYPRFFALGVIYCARLWNGQHGISIFFNVNASLIVVCNLILEVLEDAVVWWFPCKPNYSKDAKAVQYYDKLDVGSPYASPSNMSIEYIKGEHITKMPALFVITVVAIFWVIASFCLLLGEPFVLGESDEIHFSLTNGALLVEHD